ncbi:MAG TPA: efflux RND transporter periplasmic adaptor subunit [Noviherbaspirillum sp.]|jgi:RND family efflux transporter MFP subunit|uniref:efflux RND transporter periplasmic adaptor subunit n=1 Tax=Noviherbaspirillum sp. TaxID=1926288 RepID=UPI002F929A83
MNRPLLRKRRSFWIFVLACLLAAGVTAAILKRPARLQSAQVPPQGQVTPVLEFLAGDLVEARPGELRRLLPLSGSLRALQQAGLKARVPGEVREVLVREGETVQPGQVLVRMDAADYQARLEQARGALLAARGQLEIAAKARENNRALLEKGFISKNAFDNADSQFRIAQANVDSARAALDVAQKALGDTVVKAPFAGIVSSRSVQPGEKVSADNRLLDVVDLARLEMEAAVPAADILHVTPGQEVRLRVEGLAQPLTGKVARINPATQPGSRSILVYVQVDNPDRVLRAGMFAEAHLTLARKEGVLVLPQSAVQTDGGANYVYAIENGRLARKPVKTGMAGSDGARDAVEIVDGLAPGAKVVRVNLGTLRPGTEVKLAPASAP